MAAIIGIGAYLGSRLDAKFQFEKAYLTAACAMIALAIALYLILKDVSRG